LSANVGMAHNTPNNARIPCRKPIRHHTAPKNLIMYQHNPKKATHAVYSNVDE